MTPSPATTAISLSGGADSAYYLWRWLRRHPGEHILVHHCRLESGRVEHEQRAVQRILAYLGTDRITYVGTVFQRGGISGRLQDIEQIFWLLGLTLRDSHRFPAVREVLMPRCAEELAANRPLAAHLAAGGRLDTFAAPGNRIAAARHLLALGSRRALRLRSPWQHLSKADMINGLPLPIVEALHCCREPLADGRPCATCHACRLSLAPIQARLAAPPPMTLPADDAPADDAPTDDARADDAPADDAPADDAPADDAPAADAPADDAPADDARAAIDVQEAAP